MAGRNYAVLKINKLNRKNRPEIKKRCEHVNRTDFAENVNKELSHLNKCVVGGENGGKDPDWLELFKNRYDELQHYKNPGSRKLHKNAVIGLEAIATMSHDMGNKIDIDAWVDATNKWMQNHFGKDNVLHGVLHMDEATPHIHYYITPVLDGKFNARELMGNKTKYRDRQTEYAKAVEHLGLKRGLKRADRMNYESMPALYQKTGQVADIPESLENETLEEYRERNNKAYRDLQMRNKKLELDVERLEITQDYATDLEKENDKLQADYNKLNSKNKKLEHNFKNRRIGNYFVEDLIYAIDEYPDKDVVAKYLAEMASLNAWGKEFNDRIDRDGENKEVDSIDDIDKDTPTDSE